MRTAADRAALRVKRSGGHVIVNTTSLWREGPPLDSTAPL